MADEQLTTFKLNLDADDFTKGLSSIKDTMSGLGKDASLSGLIEGLTSVATVAGIVGTAAIALKGSLDLVFDDEKIKQTELAFDNLTKSVGISNETLRSGLVEAAGGLLTEQELLQAANKAIVTMGASAEKLPQLMDAARKATVLFGGSLQENFEQLNQAIASGNTRILKHMGIIIDTNKAYEDFAKANGISVNAMSEAAKQQAVLNAVLDYSRERFAGVNSDTLKATNSWIQLKNTIKELGEAVASVFDRILGPTITNFIQMTADATRSFKNFLLMLAGSDQEKAKAHIDDLNQSTQFLKKSIDELEKKRLTVTDPAELEVINQEILEQKKALDAAKQGADQYKEKLKELEEQKVDPNKLSGVGKASAPSLVDKEKQKEEYSKFQSELLKLQQERIKQELQLSQNEVEQDALFEKLKVQNKQESQAKIAAIESSKEFSPEEKSKLKIAVLEEEKKKEESIDQERLKKKISNIQEQLKAEDNLDRAKELSDRQKEVADAQHELRKKQIMQSDLLNDAQKKQALLQEERAYQNELYKINEQSFNNQKNIIDNWEKHADGAAQKFARGFAAGSLKAKQSLLDFTSQGEKTFDIMTKHMESAFEKLGEGAQKGSDVMRGAMMGMIADIAEAYGKMALEAGLIPPNPVYLAAGAALLALAGYLRGQASGSSSGGIPGGSSGGSDVSGLGSLGGAPSANAVDNNVLDQRQAKAVHLEVHGSILDSEATATRIAELVRQAADSTDFRISKVGGGI